MDAMDKINVRIERLRNRPDAGPAELSRLPPTIQQATANICLEGAELLARDTVLQGEFPAGTFAAPRQPTLIVPPCS